MPKRASYREAVRWIADNDAPADDEPVDVLAGYTTVLLVADVFGREAEDVARDVWRVRHPRSRY